MFDDFLVSVYERVPIQNRSGVRGQFHPDPAPQSSPAIDDFQNGEYNAIIVVGAY